MGRISQVERRLQRKMMFSEKERKNEYINSTIVKINPVENKTNHKIITSYKISRVSVYPFQAAIIYILLIDNNDRFIDTTELEMNEEEYKAWGSDDNYINTFICSKLGFTSV